MRLDENTTIGGDPGAQADLPHIGPYRIQRLLGEGGMGRVYLAIQDHPQREVALKIVRGLSTQAIGRMRREIEMLAKLEHPGIARLYAAGESRIDDVAVPWLAMEYVDGVDLAGHVAATAPDVDTRLRLLIAICEAVHFAHLRGVIHRDLKPGNILVDAHGRPRILDFGIARMRDADAATLTQAGQVLGTLPWMSPEQLAGGDVDPRADVYSLGVIAYELIGGRLPHPRLSTSSLFEAIDILRNEAPQPLATIAPRARGDLETVIMKAIASEPERRYATAVAFADDLRRIREHRPVAARRASLAYRSLRFVRRYRALTAAAAVTFLVLAAASLVSLRFALAEQHARADAELRARESAAVNAFLERMLASANPEFTRGTTPTVGELVDAAQRDLDRLADQPAVQRSVATTLAQTRRALGEYPAALELNERAITLLDTAAVSPTPRERLLLLHQRAILLTELARFDDARSAVREARAAWPDAPVSSRLSIDLTAARIDEDSGQMEAAENAYRAILAQATGIDPATDPMQDDLAATVETARSNLSGLLRERGALDEAESLVRDILAARRERLGERAPATLASRHKLSMILAARGENEAAAREARATLDLQREVLGDEHAATLTTMQGLANMLIATGDLDTAEQLARESLHGFETRYGEAHAQSLAAMNTLAYLSEERARPDEAEALYRRIIAIEERAHTSHPTSLAPRNNLAMLLLETGRVETALVEFDDLLERTRATVGDDHAMTAIFLSNRGLCLSRMGRLGEARRVLEDAHARLLAMFGADHARTRAAAERLAEVRARLDKRTPKPAPTAT